MNFSPFFPITFLETAGLKKVVYSAVPSLKAITFSSSAPDVHNNFVTIRLHLVLRNKLHDLFPQLINW